MQFLPDVYVTCEVCKGKRYNREALEIHFKGNSIADVLEMTIAEALEFFSAVPNVKAKLQTLFDVGLGLRPSRPAGDDALRRRGAAGQAGDRAVPAGDRPDPLRPRRADDRPPLRRRREAARGPPPARRGRQHGPRHRAQPGRHQDCRLDRRPRTGGWRARRPDHRRGHAREGRGDQGLGDGRVPGAGAPRRAARAAVGRDVRGGRRSRQRPQAGRRSRPDQPEPQARGCRRVGRSRGLDTSAARCAPPEHVRPTGPGAVTS